MKKLLLSLLCVAMGGAASAQIFWEPRATTFTAASRGVSQISFADANNVWINAYDGVTTSNVIQEWARSTDGGNTWSSGLINIGNTALGIGSIQAVSGTTAYVAAYVSAGGPGGGIWITTNGGTTWTKQPTALFNTPVDAFPNLVYFWDANEGICQGDPTGGYFEIYKTLNGGTNWTRVSQANIPANLVDEYGYVRNFASVGDDFWFGTNMGRIYHSSNRGNSFDWAAQSPLSDFGSATVSGSYAFQDATKGLLISGDWQFWRTTNGGQTWTEEVPVGVIRNGDLCIVPGAGGCTYVNLGTDIDFDTRGSSYTTDGGLNWTDVNELGDDVNVNGTGAVNFYNTAVGLAAGFSTSASVGGIFKYVGSPDDLNSTCNMATNSYTSTKNFTASPNPTSGMLNLAGKSISNVTVYDVLGKEVANKNFSALNNVSFDLSSFNNGVYMVKITNAAGNSDTIKVVKQ
jgi:photosystem II stability/assembly factor-like uncharacterized protein